MLEKKINGNLMKYVLKTATLSQQNHIKIYTCNLTEKSISVLWTQYQKTKTQQKQKTHQSFSSSLVQKI